MTTDCKVRNFLINCHLFGVNQKELQTKIGGELFVEKTFTVQVRGTLLVLPHSCAETSKGIRFDLARAS